jgi:hypothetical protein
VSTNLLSIHGPVNIGSECGVPATWPHIPEHNAGVWHPATHPASPTTMYVATHSSLQLSNQHQQSRLVSYLTHTSSAHSTSSAVPHRFDTRRRQVVAAWSLFNPPGPRSKMSAQPVMLPQGWEARW